MALIEIIGGPRDGTYSQHDDETFAVTAENHIRDGYLLQARYRLVGGVYRFDCYFRRTMIIDPTCWCARCERSMPMGTKVCLNCKAIMVIEFGEEANETQ